jgi:hypothetical protein
MCIKNLKLDIPVDQPQLIPKVELPKSLEFFIQWGRMIFIYEKFKSPGVLKVVYDNDNKTFVQELYKILRSSSCKWAVKIETFEKKIHGRVKI